MGCVDFQCNFSNSNSHSHIHTHTHTHSFIHSYTHIHTFIHTHTHTHIHSFIHTHIHTHTHTLTNTNTKKTGTWFTIICTMAGTGILQLPLTLQQGGWIGLVLIVVVRDAEHDRKMAHQVSVSRTASSERISRYRREPLGVSDASLCTCFTRQRFSV